MITDKISYYATDFDIGKTTKYRSIKNSSSRSNIVSTAGRSNIIIDKISVDIVDCNIRSIEYGSIKNCAAIRSCVIGYKISCDT